MDRIAKNWPAIKAGMRSVAIDAMTFGGAAAVAYGSWLVYEPAGYIVGGALAVGMAYAISTVNKP